MRRWSHVLPGVLVQNLASDWAEGFTEHWQAAQDRTFSPDEREAFRGQIAEAKAQAAAEPPRM